MLCEVAFCLIAENLELLWNAEGASACKSLVTGIDFVCWSLLMKNYGSYSVCSAILKTVFGFFAPAVYYVGSAKIVILVLR